MLQHQDEFVDLFSYFRTLKKNIFIFIFCFQIFLRFRRVWLRGFAFWSFLSSKQSVFPSFFLPFISVFFHKFILSFLSFLFCLLQKIFQLFIVHFKWYISNFLSACHEIFSFKNFYLKRNSWRRENKRNFCLCFISPLSLKPRQLKSEKFVLNGQGKFTFKHS